MGQRHQLYVVARIGGAYRRIVGLHHQWYYGKAALEGAVRFMKACQHPFNIHSILSELYHVDLDSVPEDLNPCPFIASLLWGCISNRVTASAPSLGCQNTDMISDKDNNDGITVFDITDPSNPRYCFVSVSGLEAAIIDKCDAFVPLTGKTYGRAYYPSGQVPRTAGDRGWEQAVAAAIGSIKEFETIPYETLKLCWPHEFGRNIPAGHDGGLSGQRERAVPPTLSLYALMKIPCTEWTQVPEQVVRACAKISGAHNQYPEPLTQRLLSVLKEGVLDLGGISITLTEVIQIVHGIPFLAQNTLYLNLSTWMNPEGGLVKLSDLAALRQCFPQLLCVNAIGNQHFHAVSVSEWYESDSPSFVIFRHLIHPHSAFLLG
ncbi:uncharacterized protein EI90DRAFT_113459 [Cantharellus anzutake]|uniref:uncharacterized protein n=1 Tax=Cantharellus anzutake TaxID=1750568 RepID=UPI0019063C7F|nr:uncharacterized protein EI90DRAFT_113459 [Cantharellus anzutake]KAF8318308.1 hypothetical protein EI90DRAFT_113459 [Cantharellus anzutake]